MTVAAIDIGSNSVRLLVVGQDGEEQARETVVTALGTDLERTGSFDAAAYDATIEVLARYAATIVSLGADEVRAVATSASRDARNGAALMADIGRILGDEPTIIDGAREAQLSFAGATTGLDAEGTKLVIDVGGGSTEFVHGDHAPSYAVSVDMGSVRLTDRCFDRRPPSLEDLDRAHAAARASFASVTACDDPGMAIGVAGTFTSLAAIALRLDAYDREAVHGSTLTLATVESLVSWLSGLSVAETALIPSLDPARARVILAGAIIVQRAMAHCGLDEVVVSDRGLLDGLILERPTP